MSSANWAYSVAILSGDAIGERPTSSTRDACGAAFSLSNSITDTVKAFPIWRRRSIVSGVVLVSMALIVAGLTLIRRASSRSDTD